MLIIVILEIGCFNLPFWSTISTPEAPDHTTVRLGEGLERSKASAASSKDGASQESGVLHITDNTASYIEIDNINTRVDVLHIISGDATKEDTSLQGDGYPLLASIHGRIDYLPASGDPDNNADWHTGENDAWNRYVDASAYLRNRFTTQPVKAIRLWVQERNNSQIPYQKILVNDTPPFHISLVRVAVMAAIAATLIALRPSSRLYRITLDTSDRRQRMALALIAIPLTAALVNVILRVPWLGPQWSHDPYSYTYDFNQYPQIADSLLHGRPWLDLPVPDALSQADNPYDIGTRNELLRQGVGDIYWDHVFFNGHWYSYFGVIPAIVVFLPYQLVTSLWVPGGAWLPSTVASTLFTIGFVIFAALTVVRLLNRFLPGISVGVTALAILGLLCGSNMWFIWLRSTFYEIPLASAIMMTMLALWLWLGARRVQDADTGRWRAWRIDDLPSSDTASSSGTDAANTNTLSEARLPIRISKTRLALGSLFMACTLGCRAPFIAAAMLFLPIFADEIRSGLLLRFLGPLLPKRWRTHMFVAADQPRRSGKALSQASAANGMETPTTPRSRATGSGAWTLPWFSSLRRDAATLLPACAVFAGLLWYNLWRFGSLLDFGNDYQLTVTDLTRYREPPKVLLEIIGYYLFLPPHTTSRFPWFTAPYSPLSEWQYHERLLCGFLWFAPICLLLFCIPWLRRALQQHRIWGMTLTLIGLGVVELVFVSYKGGMDWRYVCDFAWWFALAAVLLLATAFITLPRDGKRRWLLIALPLLGVLAIIFGTFMTGRINPLINADPTMYYTVRSWFSWLFG